MENVNNGERKINVSNLYLYDIVNEFEKNMGEEAKFAMQVKWDNYPRNLNLGNTIVVRDGSGSITPLKVADSLSIYFSELLKGEFKNKFITFSAEPKLIELKGVSLFEKLNEVSMYNDYTNTNISKIYDLLINVYKNEREEIIDRIIIISDMEFDSGVECESTFEAFKKNLIN